MTRKEAIAYFKRHIDLYCVTGICREAEEIAIKALEQEPTPKNDLGVDCISREQAIEEADKLCLETGYDNEKVIEMLNELPSVTPQEPKCKDCKWWKDSDGKYRRGCGAESICRINTDKVYQGEGYCYMFEPQESEDEK